MLTITALVDFNSEVCESFQEDEFDAAIEFCEMSFGYEGMAWDMVKDTRKLENLQEFLANNGVDAFLD